MLLLDEVQFENGTEEEGIYATIPPDSEVEFELKTSEDEEDEILFFDETQFEKEEFESESPTNPPACDRV